MKKLSDHIARIRGVQSASGRALSIVLAGHNGSGKSTLWYEQLAGTFQIPLVNADRMMMSILPEPRDHQLPGWASNIRDTDTSWMEVAQRGVDGFVAHAMAKKVSFARETVFSHWREQPDGTIESKIDQIVEMQRAGYFVLLLFVGLSNWLLSVGRVQRRVQQGGHDVALAKLIARFGRTQSAIREAAKVADATIFLDNSRTQREAFTVCRVQLKEQVEFDLRQPGKEVAKEISAWLDIVSPL